MQCHTRVSGPTENLQIVNNTRTHTVSNKGITNTYEMGAKASIAMIAAIMACVILI